MATTSLEKRRVGIVGAGPGGLAAAMLLTQAGAEVTVFERLPRLGGRAGTITVPSPDGQASYRFDMGPTFFLYPRVLADIFAACGRRMEDEVELIRIDPQYRLVFEGGGEICASGDMERLAAEIARLSPEDARALPRFMADNRAKLAAFRPALETAFDSMAAFATPAMLRALPKLRPHRTVDTDLATYFKDPRVRLAFSFQSKYLGMSPYRCPSLFTILAFMEYQYGVWHPRGGCGAVMAAMARVAAAQGADIRLGEPVEEILFDGRRAAGIRTAGGTHRFDALVLNADFANTMQTLVPDSRRPAWSDARLARKKFSCSTFMLYLGIEGRLDHVSHHTIYLSREYRRNVDEIDAGLAPEAPSFYVQNASVTDDTLAPPGHSTLYVLIPVGNLSPGSPDWPAIQQRYRRLALDRLARIGIEDIDRRIRTERVLTPVGWRDDMAIHRGATFNLAHSMGQMFHRRPRNRFADIPGMYLVGGGTHPGSGLPVIFESARITSRLLERDLGLARAAPDPVSPLPHQSVLAGTP